MNKIAFFVQLMGAGGVEKTLIDLTGYLADQGHDVTIFSILNEGSFLKKIPKNVNFSIISMNEKLRRNIAVGGFKRKIIENYNKRNYIKAAYFIKEYIFHNNEFAELSKDLSSIPFLDEEFDIVVNYHIHSPFLVWYVDQKTRAKRKYTWIHNDFKTTNYQISKLKSYLLNVDRFFCVSENLEKEFKAIFPDFKDKTQTALNILPYSKIVASGDEFYPAEYLNSKDKIKILTVGRLEEQKGIDLAIQAAKRLADLNLDFIWFVIGEGNLKNSLNKQIRDNCLDNNFRLIGLRENPYPYYKNCDIYVQSSRHEGYVTAVSEAKIFKRPIVCTKVSGALEQIDDSINGYIVDVSQESIFEKLNKLLTDKSLCYKFSNNIHISRDVEKPEWLSYLEREDL